MLPPTDAEFNKGEAQLPQIILTSNQKWIPSCIDSEPDYDTYFDALSDIDANQPDLPFDDYGEYIKDPDIAALWHDTYFGFNLELNFLFITR